MKQRGFALLLVLAIIVIMSSLVYTTHNSLFSIKYGLTRYNNKQADKWFLLATEALVLNNAVKRLLNGKYVNSTLLSLFVLPESLELNNKEYSIKIVDNTNCFNTNSLPLNLNGDKQLMENYHWQVFRELFLVSGISVTKTNGLLMAIIERFYQPTELNKLYYNADDIPVMDRGQLYKKDIINFLSSSGNDVYLKVVPILCHRKDDELLININSLEVRHSKLVQAMLLNTLGEKHIEDIILSKPDYGWESSLSFYNLINDGSSIYENKKRKLQKVILSNFSHDKYYAQLLLWVNDLGYYLLASDLLITQKGISIQSRSYIGSGKHK